MVSLFAAGVQTTMGKPWMAPISWARYRAAPAAPVAPGLALQHLWFLPCLNRPGGVLLRLFAPIAASGGVAPRCVVGRGDVAAGGRCSGTIRGAFQAEARSSKNVLFRNLWYYSGTFCNPRDALLRRPIIPRAKNHLQSTASLPVHGSCCPGPAARGLTGGSPKTDSALLMGCGSA